jgi:hypothetical protein
MFFFYQRVEWYNSCINYHACIQQGLEYGLCYWPNHMLEVSCFFFFFFLATKATIVSKWEWFPPEIHQPAFIFPSLCSPKKNTARGMRTELVRRQQSAIHLTYESPQVRSLIWYHSIVM